MNDTGKEYAAALFDLAAETDSFNEVGASLDLVADVLTENPEYGEYLSCIIISKQERTADVSSAFDGRIHPLVENMLLVMCERNDVSSLLSVREEYGKLIDWMNRVVNVKVVSAFSLSDAEKESLTAKLEKITARNVRADYTVDPSLLGGMTVEIEGRVYDCSIRSELASMKEVMLNG